jgi:hypothetical protein
MRRIVSGIVKVRETKAGSMEITIPAKVRDILKYKKAVEKGDKVIVSYAGGSLLKIKLMKGVEK